MSVYADSLFLVNFISEYILLILTEKTGTLKIKSQRKISAAALGAVLSVILFCTDFSTLEAAAAKILTICLITFICIGAKLGMFLRFGAVFTVLTYIYGGIFSQISGFFGEAAIRNGFTYININTTLFLLIFICTYPIVLIISKLINYKKRIYKLSVSLGEKATQITALCDSGNLLKHKGEGVIIVEWGALKNLFDFTEYEQLYERIEDLKLSIIPYTSLGAESKTLIVFECDTLTLKDENKKFHNIPIGAVNRTISPKGTYNALIGTEYTQ